MSYLIGTDIGTLGTKSVLVDVEGKVLSTSFEEYGVITPRQGWAEQWPDIWAQAVFKTIKQVVEVSKIDPKDVAGACISSLYGGSGIPCDGEMKPLRPCIIWADRRATEECQWAREKIGVDEIFNVTGNVIDPYYGYTKMLWIRNHEQNTWKRIHRFVTPNSYCIQKLTGVESVDLSSAGNYGGIFDIRERDWSEEMMEQLRIPRSMFPEKISSSDEIAGEITLEGSRLTGLKLGTPVCAGGIDAAVSALAGGAILDGDLASMLGTSMCNGFISHRLRLSPKMINFPNVIDGTRQLYSFTGVVTAGYCVRWFRDEFGKAEKVLAADLGEDPYSLLDREAEKIPAGSDGLIFLPHMMVGERAPYWNDYLRGALLGLTIFHTRPHVFRAVLEGVIYAMRFSIEAALETGFPLNRATLVDGGAKSPLWRQIIADVTGLSMDYIPKAIGAPLGDALLAGLGSGVLRDHKVIDEWLGTKVRIQPDENRKKIYDKLYRLYKDSLEANKEVFKKLGESSGSES